MIPKIVSGATIVGGLILDAVGCRHIRRPAHRPVSQTCAADSYQRRHACAADPTCNGDTIVNGAK